MENGKWKMLFLPDFAVYWLLYRHKNRACLSVQTGPFK